MYSQNYSLNSQLKIWMITLLVMIVLIILVGGLTRLTDSGLSITSWELFIGSLPPLTNDKWIEYFDLYKTIPEFKEQNFNMTLNEFKIIFWWEWAHRQLGRLIGLTVLFPMIYFTIKNGFWILKEYSIIFFLVCFQGFIGWYMVSSGLIDRIDVSHYRLSLHLVTAFIILSIVFWKYLNLIKKYPKSLIAIERKILINGLNKRFDLLVFDKLGKPNIIVECKSPKVEIDQKALDQVLSYQNKLAANFIVLTNGLKTYYLEIDLDLKKVSYIKEIPEYSIL